MGIYIYADPQVEEIVRSSQRLRRRFCLGAALILVAACVVAMLQPMWIFGTANHARGWVIAALFVFFAGPLGDNLLRWKSRSQRVREQLRALRIEVSSEGVRVLRA